MSQAWRSSNDCLFGASDGGIQPNRLELIVLGVQKKAIAAAVRGPMKEVLKDHIGALQLANVVRPRTIKFSDKK